MGVLQFLSKCFFGIAVLVLILLYVPGIPPHVNYVAFKVDPALPKEGPLAKNNILDGAERLHEGRLIGPESMASRAINELFVSLHNGSIARIWGHEFEKLKIVATIGPGCGGSWEEHICGRPLGLRFSGRKLIIADAYLGIFALDVDTGEKAPLVDPNNAIDGVKPKIFNDLDVDQDGNVYFSDSSTNVVLADGVVELLAEPSGRLIKFDFKNKRSEVLLSNLHFSNGVQLSADEEFVMVAESFRHKVHRYWLKGLKAGSSDIFVSKLPGMPDNIRPRNDGGYYISLVGTRSPEIFDMYAATSTWPGLKKVILRINGLVQSVLNLINSYFPNKFCAAFSYKIFHMSPLSDWIFRNESIVVEVNEEGEIVGSLQGYKGNLKMVSETQQVGNSLFFGSPFAHYLGRLRVDEMSKSTDKSSTTKKKPSTTKKEKPSTTKKEKPSTTKMEKPSTIKKEKPSTTKKEKPSTTKKEKPSTTKKEKPSITKREKPSKTKEEL